MRAIQNTVLFRLQSVTDHHPCHRAMKKGIDQKKGQVFYVSTRPRNEHRGGLYEECAYCELSVLIIHCWNYTFQPCRRDKVQTTYNYLDLGVGLGQLPLLLV